MTKRLRSPIIWFGGKGNMVDKILPLLPPHKIYVEPFGGGASILLAKPPSEIEVYNDLNSDLVNFFRVLRDKDKFEQFYQKVCLTPYSREEYNYCKNTWENVDDEIERAYRWFVVARMSFSGNFGASWKYNVTSSSKKMSKTVADWLSIIDMLPEICERLMQVQIENNDFRKILQTYDTPETLFYMDPPYVPETRKSGEYKHEMTLEDHEELVNILLNLKGMVVLSGYNHECYKPLEDNGWIKHEYKTACSAAGRTRQTGILGKGAATKMQPRTEVIWRNPAAVKQTTIGMK